MHVTLPTPFETNGQQDLKIQIVDNTLTAGCFTPVTLIKHGPGGLTGLGIDAQGTAAIRDNLFTGGTVVNSGRIPIVSSLALGTGPVTVRDGGQVAFFAVANAGGGFVPNNFAITGLGTGEAGGYLGAIRLGGNVIPGVVAGNVAFSGETRIHDQNTDLATVAGLITGTGVLQKTGANVAVFSNLANTYTGATTIGTRDLAGGTLQVSRLANGGTPSSIGASSSAASNLLLQGGTLRYAGPGDSTDRLFTLGTQVAVNAVVTHTIDAAGYGSLNFTNPGTIAQAPGTFRTLQLTSTIVNGGANILNGTLRGEHLCAGPRRPEHRPGEPDERRQRALDSHRKPHLLRHNDRQRWHPAARRRRDQRHGRNGRGDSEQQRRSFHQPLRRGDDQQPDHGKFRGRHRARANRHGCNDDRRWPG